MRYTGKTLAECERPMIRLICDKCGRKRQYRKATLVARKQTFERTAQSVEKRQQQT
jgi:hypothetical protein